MTCNAVSRNPHVGRCLSCKPDVAPPACFDCRVTRLCPLIGFCVSFPTPYHLNTGWSKLGNLSPRGQGQNAASFPVPAGSTMQGSAWHPEDRNQPGVVKVDSTRATCRASQRPCMNRTRCCPRVAEVDSLTATCCTSQSTRMHCTCR